MTENYSQTSIGEDIYLTPKGGNYDKVLIFMHGLGDSPTSFIQLFTSKSSFCSPSTKIILLSSPLQNITVFKGLQMRSWFDVLKLGFNSPECYNYNDIQKNSMKVFKIIKNEGKHFSGDYSKIFVGGFSQGAIMSFNIGFTTPYPIGGIIACSGVFIPNIIIEEHNKKLKVFQGHGGMDNMIEINVAKAGLELLKKNGGEVTFKEYPEMEHTISDEEIEDIRKFLSGL